MFGCTNSNFIPYKTKSAQSLTATNGSIKDTNRAKHFSLDVRIQPNAQLPFPPSRKHRCYLPLVSINPVNQISKPLRPKHNNIYPQKTGNWKRPQPNNSKNQQNYRTFHSSNDRLGIHWYSV